VLTLTERELTSKDKSISLTGGCQNKIGFVRTSSPDYYDWYEIEGYSLNCHMWNCSVCSKVLKNRLLDRIRYGLEGDHEFFFMTLTSSFRNMDIKAAFHRFTSNLRHKSPIGRYVWVMELTPPSHSYTDWKGVSRVSVGGLRHFHILISFTGDIPSEEKISDIWLSSTKGKAWEVHFERLNEILNPAGYLAKYVTKALQVGYLYNEKRVGFSQNFPKLPLNLEPQKGVYLPYDPRHEPKQYDDFDEMLKQANKPYLKRRNR
jgi:hypothetical protein